MDIKQSLEEIYSNLDVMDNNHLLRLLTSLENIITKTRDILSKSNSPPPPPPPSAPSQQTSTKFEDLFAYVSQPLDNDLVSRVHGHIKELVYHPSSKSANSPEIYLYGDHPYSYSRESSRVSPTPISASPINPMSELLCSVNSLLQTNYNSILINRYRNLHCCLAPHKDDEKSLDPSSPISALSLGATRRMQISLNKDKNKAVHTVNLEPRSLCTMFPGFQEQFYHSIAAGRRSINKEKGVRFSITLRCILPDSNGPKITPHILSTLVEKPEEEKEVEEEEEEEKEEDVEEDVEYVSPDTLIFGSSLTKGLDETLLSKHSKKFRVFTNPGAKVKDIQNEVERVEEEKETGALDFDKVTTIFFVCGGNDVGRLIRDSDINTVYKDFENLVNYTKIVFPNSNINVLSLIPRRSSYRTHIDNMHEINEWLANFCHENSLRFVNIFSHFLLKLPQERRGCLNKKLFRGDNIHFSNIGSSVLAKVLIGVANSPRVTQTG